MKKLLILTLVAGSFGVVTSAQAQPGHRAKRSETVAVVGHGHPRYARYAPAHHRAPMGATQRRLEHERRDLRQIVDISRAWRSSSARRDRYETAMSDRRLEIWLAKELREGRHDPYDRRYRYLVDLSRELDNLHWRFDHGRARARDLRRKSQILHELVTMSRVEFERARTRHQGRWYAQASRR
ncbi:MAG: hypothetical protein WBG86_11395 [Polyangiales bacterium]